MIGLDASARDAARRRGARDGRRRRRPLRRRRRARAAVRRSAASTRRCACACSCTRSTGGRCLAELCRVVAVARRRRFSRARELRGARERARGMPASRSDGRVEAYRVIAERDVAPAFARARVSRRRWSTASSCCRSPSTRRSAALGFTQRRRARRWPRSGSVAPARIAGHDGGRAVKVLVTGATGFTGGHLARFLARRGDAVRALVRRRDRGRAICDQAGIEVVEGDLTDRGQPAARGRRRRRRLQHRRAVPRGRSAGGRLSRRQRRRRSAPSSSCARPPARAASCTAARSASTATSSIRRPTKTRRSRPATSIRRRSSKASASAARPPRASGMDLVIARPTGIYGPGDRRLFKIFGKIATAPIRHARPRHELLPRHLHRRPLRGLPPLRARCRPPRAAPTSSAAGR